MLTLSYTLEKEDYVNYYAFVMWDAPENKKKRLLYYVKQVLPIFFFVWAFYYTGLFKRDSLFIFVIAGFLILTSLLSLLGVRTNMLKQAEKIANNPDNQSIFLPTILSVSESGLVFKSDIQESKYQWKAFIKKQESTRYYFLFISAIQGVIIPKRAFSNAEEKARFEKLLQHNLSFEAELGHMLKS